MVRGVLSSRLEAMASPARGPQPARMPVGACGHRARTRSKMRGAPRRRAERLTVLSAKHSSTLRQVLEYSAASTTSLPAACFSALPALRPSRHAPTTECEADASLPPGKRARPQAAPAPPLLASAQGIERARKQFYNYKKCAEPEKAACHSFLRFSALHSIRSRPATEAGTQASPTRPVRARPCSRAAQNDECRGARPFSGCGPKP